MNDGLNIFILITAMLIVTVALRKLGTIRYVCLVPEEIGRASCRERVLQVV